MKCFVYRNLNRRGCVYSFKALEGPYKGLVVAYAEAFIMKDVEFHVSHAGWQRCIRQKKRNVHAGLIGEVERIDHATQRLTNDIEVGYVGTGLQSGGTRIIYDPYKTHGTFVDLMKHSKYMGGAVHYADRVNCYKSNLLAFGIIPIETMIRLRVA